MTDELYLEETRLEEEARGLTISRFHKEHLEGTLSETFSETLLGSHLLRNYLVPYEKGIREWLTEANSGKPGRRNLAAKLLEGVETPLIAFLMLKSILSKVGIYQEGRPCSLTGLCIHGAGLIHDELRLREFDELHHRLSKRIHEDFDKRELPRYKREEYMQREFAKQNMDWAKWSKADMVHVGMALVDIFRDVTGDIEVVTSGSGASKMDVVQASLGLIQAVEAAADHCEALFTTYFPMVVPPVPWSAETLERGGYLTHHVSAYPLVKNSKRAYKGLLKKAALDGTISRVLDGVNALQETRWRVNTEVLDVMEWVYERNIKCGKLPRADRLEPDPPPTSLEGLDADDPRVKEYRAYCFKIHEHNRRVVGKRVMATRSFQVARKMSKYDTIYFPHDLDSRGRAYPRPSALNPQGPDYVKGLLQFAEGKALGPLGLFWLGVHGANCYGHDKLPLDERAAWSLDNIDLARSVARDPRQNASLWTKADNPAQFLAWCFDWARAHSTSNPEGYISHLHVDLDATCSGLQHFSAMLLDKTGGFHVNMTPNKTRQDVYAAVAQEALAMIGADAKSNSETSQLALAWLRFGVPRSVAKRPVMVKPYSGTRQSCTSYVADSVNEMLEDGVALPWPKKELWDFKVYGSGKIWAAIPKVVVAADGAMKWLSTVSRLVGKSQPALRRIEWTTPLGFPVHQYKFDTISRRVTTKFDGKIIMPRITEDTDKLDARRMASSVAPSFVHSLDACHLQATMAAAREEGMTDFAAVHDSFGVHACDIPKFTRIIREQFVKMYSEHDVLSEFLASAKPLISEEFQEEIPPVPAKGTLDLQGILENEFFFS